MRSNVLMPGADTVLRHRPGSAAPAEPLRTPHPPRRPSPRPRPPPPRPPCSPSPTAPAIPATPPPCAPCSPTSPPPGRNFGSGSASSTFAPPPFAPPCSTSAPSPSAPPPSLSLHGRCRSCCSAPLRRSRGRCRCRAALLRSRFARCRLPAPLRSSLGSVVAVPLFLSSGYHVHHDVPLAVSDAVAPPAPASAVAPGSGLPTTSTLAAPALTPAALRTAMADPLGGPGDRPEPLLLDALDRRLREAGVWTFRPIWA